MHCSIMPCCHHEHVVCLQVIEDSAVAYGVDYECRLQSNKTEIPALMADISLKFKGKFEKTACIFGHCSCLLLYVDL